MEALVILLLEFLLAPIILLFTLLFNVLICVIGLIIELIFKASTAVTTKCANKTNPEPQKKRGNSIKITHSVFFAKTVYALKWLRNVSLFLIVSLVCVLFIINFALFEPTIQWILTKVGQKTNIELNAGHIKGNIFTGKISVYQLQVKRESPIKTSFKLAIDELSLDIDWLSLILRPITLDTLFINKVTGNITQPSLQAHADDNGNTDKEPTIKAKRLFVINNLDVNKINIMFAKNGDAPIPVFVDKINTPKFRSNYAIFDLFFRSNITASIDGHPISIATSEIDSGRITHWHIPNFPVDILAHFVNKPPINWLKGGIINVEVKDKWQLNDKANIEMDWHLQTQGLLLEPPADIPFLKRQLAFAITHYINSKSGNIDLRLRTVINENQFKNAFSLDASGLWDELNQTISNSIINKIHLKGELNNTE